MGYCIIFERKNYYMDQKGKNTLIKKWKLTFGEVSCNSYSSPNHVSKYFSVSNFGHQRFNTKALDVL